MTTLTLAAVATTMLIIGYLAGRYLPTHRHDWDKWEFLRQTKIVDEYSGMPIRTEATYVRKCKTCGRVKTRREKL